MQNVPEKEIIVEVEDVVESPKKTDDEIIMERFQNMDWAEVHAAAKQFGQAKLLEIIQLKSTEGMLTYIQILIQLSVC